MTYNEGPLRKSVLIMPKKEINGKLFLSASFLGLSLASQIFYFQLIFAVFTNEDKICHILVKTHNYWKFRQMCCNVTGAKLLK